MARNRSNAFFAVFPAYAGMIPTPNRIAAQRASVFPAYAGMIHL